jgi:hypothetical protein
MTRTIIAAAVAIAASATLLAQGPRRDGNWQVTVEMSMANMPQGMTMPPMPPMTQCITKEEAADPTKAIPARPQRGGAAAQSDCKVSNYKVDGNKVSWDMTCTGATPMTGTSEFIYAGDTYTGTMKMNVERGGAPMAMTMKYTGKRLGDCTK